MPYLSTSSAADQNLLFGVVALQMDFISRDALVAAMHAWAADKTKSLGEILVTQQALSTQHHAMLAALVEEHIKQHGDDPQRSLQSISSLQSVRAELEQIADSDVQASLAQVPSRSEGNNGQPPPDRTLPLSAVTSSGTRFRFLRPWREGGLGKVSVAQDDELHREVALKEIKHQHARNQQSRVRFLLEAEVTGALEHPGIVPVYGLGHYADGRPFYAMRFVRGDSLEEAIERFHKGEAAGTKDKGPGTKDDQSQRTVAFRELLGRFIDVCNAVAYAHSRGVLHRDLKPGNIILGKYGETLVVDWGLAKVQGKKDELATSLDEAPVDIQPGSGSAPTQAGALIGTPAFMSPEQANGRLDLLGPTSDVYSLGATLYVLLTGAAPFNDRIVSTVLTKVRAGDFPRPRQVDSTIARGLEAICLKAMSLKPADRYATPIALADDLEHWLADEPITAQPDRLYDRLFRLARRHRGVAIATTAAAILIAVVACVATVLVNHQRRVANELAQKNDALFRSEQKASAEAKESARKEQIERDNALRLADDKTKLALLAEQASTKAKKSASDAEAARAVALKLADDKTTLANEQTRQAEKMTKLAEDEKRNREKAEKLSEFLIGAMQPDDPTRFTGATFFAPKAMWYEFKVHDMLRSQGKRAGEELRNSPEAQAAVFDCIGNVCRQLMDFRNAESLLKAALQIRQKLLKEDDPDLATSYFHTAWYYHERGDFDKAEPLYEKALAIRRKLNRRSDVAETLQNLAWLHYYDDASTQDMDRCFYEVLRIRKELLKEAPSDRGLLRDVVFTKLGMAYATAGRKRVLAAKGILTEPSFKEEIKALDKNLAEALDCYLRGIDSALDPAEARRELSRALELIRAGGKGGSDLAGVVHYELAVKLTSLNQLQEAEKQYSHAIKICRDVGMFQIPRQADKIKKFGTLMSRLNKPVETQKLWDEYLVAQKSRFGDDHTFYKEAYEAYRQFRSEYAAR